MNSSEKTVSLARSFLDLLEDKRLDDASALLAPDFSATYPGDRRFSNLEDLVASGRRRYHDVRKQYERTLYLPADANGHETVVFYGTLTGNWAAGGTFTQIRFTDRFLLKNGRIIEMQVWNDIAEALLRGAGVD